MLVPIANSMSLTKHTIADILGWKWTARKCVDCALEEEAVEVCDDTINKARHDKNIFYYFYYTVI